MVLFTAGFGLGALNDADEDDLDVYDNGLVGPKTNRMAYDVVDEDDRDQVAIGRRTEKAAQVKNLVGPNLAHVFIQLLSYTSHLQ